ncbi:MAG: transketolase family protein [bacterium]
MRDLVSTRDAYGNTLVQLGEKYSNLVVLDADLSASTKTATFAKKFPDRFFNMGVAEQDMIGTAAGFATTGKIVFASTFAVFATGRAWDQIKISVAYPRLNVKIVATHGGITVGEDGVTHQANEDIGMMRLLPNMTIIVPADANQSSAAITAAAKAHGPFYIRLTRSNTPIIYQDAGNFRIGSGIEVKKGSDVAIIACGIMLDKAIAAAEQLEKEKISARVIDMHTIKPLDKDMIIKAAKDTRAIVVVEEHSILGGLGSAVAEVLAEECPVPIQRIGIRDMFCESGKPEELLSKYGLDDIDIVSACKNVIKRKK